MIRVRFLLLGVSLFSFIAMHGAEAQHRTREPESGPVPYPQSYDYIPRSNVWRAPDFQVEVPEESRGGPIYLNGAQKPAAQKRQAAPPPAPVKQVPPPARPMAPPPPKAATTQTPPALPATAPVKNTPATDALPAFPPASDKTPLTGDIRLGDMPPPPPPTGGELPSLPPAAPEGALPGLPPMPAPGTQDGGLPPLPDAPPAVPTAAPVVIPGNSATDLPELPPAPPPGSTSVEAPKPVTVPDLKDPSAPAPLMEGGMPELPPLPPGETIELPQTPPVPGNAADSPLPPIPEAGKLVVPPPSAVPETLKDITPPELKDKPAPSQPQAAINPAERPRHSIRFTKTETAVPLASELILQGVATAYKRSQRPELRLIGYAATPQDQSGDALTVAQSRASAVKDYLVKQGIAEKAIRIETQASTSGTANPDRVDIFY